MMIYSSSFCFYNLLWLLLLQSLRIGVNACDFTCGDGTCINTLEMCNGRKDCADGSDETHEICANWRCKNALGLDEQIAESSFDLGIGDLSFVSSFRCKYGGCITTTFKCNGINNCADGSDETEEACKDTKCDANSFRCDYGACISRYYVCNGIKNCYDGSDELPGNCIAGISMRRAVCPKRNKRYCDSRRECYDLRKQCDGKFDCADRSDEKDELCQPDGVVATPPPPTAPPPPPTAPPGVPSQVDCPSPNCRCLLPGLEHFCLPCMEIADLNATCLSLETTDVCSMEVVRDVSLDILYCGGKNISSCVSKAKMVPVMTQVYADCWGTAQLVMRCDSDGNWRNIEVEMPAVHNCRDGSDLYLDEERSMRQLCQPFYINSQVCGRKPRYKSSGSGLDLGYFYTMENRWPMVMGLKKQERYECSATLITPLFLLTAAHCVVVSLESRNEPMDVRNLKVQLSSFKHQDQWVSEIYLHPAYEPGTKPLNDLALIRLQEKLLFNSKLYPACVDLDGYGFLSTFRAVTFNRPNGNKEHRYDKILQQLDPGCVSSLNRCGSLEIKDTQFCGVDLDTSKQLVGGSSGGPFMQNLGSSASEEWAVSGVVSFSSQREGCDLPYTIFSSVKAYKSWIIDTVHCAQYV